MLKAGDIIEIKKGHHVNAEIPRHFFMSYERGCWDLAKASVEVDGDLMWLAGKYIVTHTTEDGGGMASDMVIFANGHHVWCKKVYEKVDGESGCDWEIDFYQTGPLTPKIENIEAIGQAKLTWVYEES